MNTSEAVALDVDIAETMSNIALSRMGVMGTRLSSAWGPRGQERP
jgi:hypothetical protein